jgi:PTH1 family peptidyl-tRNA hydrolase
MKLIFALGNPGANYARTRHNVGWMMLDSLGLEWQEKPRFFAYTAEQGSGAEKVVYAKPTTYYNESGRTARAILNFYKLEPADVLVIADDLALPLGTIRTRIGGSGGGNKGIASINASIDQDYARLRIGTATELTSSHDAVGFVLSTLNNEELAILRDLQPHVHKLVRSFIDGEYPVTTHRFADIE